VARADRAAPVEVLLDEVKGRELGGRDHSGRMAPVKILLGEVKEEAAPVELPLAEMGKNCSPRLQRIWLARKAQQWHLAVI
jgi:hypothetical protein